MDGYSSVPRLEEEDLENGKDTNDDGAGESKESIEMTQLEDLGPDAITFTICRVGGSGNRDVQGIPSWTIEKLKNYAFPSERKANMNVRLIRAGRLLHDGQTLKECNIEEGSFVHCAITENRSLVFGERNEDAGANSGELVNSNGGEVEDVQVPQWLLQGHMQRNGSSGDFLLGFVMGFFLGILTLIWVWQPSVPRRQKVGILAGMACNLVFSILSPNNNTHKQPDSGGSSPSGTGSSDDKPGFGR